MLFEFLTVFVIVCILIHTLEKICNRNPRGMSNKEYAEFLDSKVEQEKNWDKK
jgi:hypothetical protein